MNFLNIYLLIIIVNSISLESVKLLYHKHSTGNERYQVELISRNVSYPPKLHIIHDKIRLLNYSNGIGEKIDALSKLLRIHINEFRDRTDRVDIVFLVDASSSIGEENFKSEINFVRRFLLDMTIDESSTRVAVVTFAGKGMIYRSIDQISPSKIRGDKCKLLNEELENINWTGGGTYTRGAFLEALKILQQSQPATKKVVLLMTDGFSNGGDPRPFAKLLKNLGAMILTFGIRTGNVLELHDVASEPGHAHSYLLDSFFEFEAIARRALYRDFKTDKYISTSFVNLCDNLCDVKTEKNNLPSRCCDDFAECSCGVTSGHYACICKVGYFGSGLIGSCHPCPNGTYGESCISCPNPNHITLKSPAMVLSDCICASGYLTINESTCDPITCPKLQVPENGYLVKANACSNVVNAACGLRCRIGYRLVGDSIRLCNNNGSWSGIETQCLLKTCPTLRPPNHGQVQCEHDDDNYLNPQPIKFQDSITLPMDTRCQFKCHSGYQLLGSKIRNCLPVSRWDGLKVSCKQIKCEPLTKVANGLISPDSCTGTKKLLFGTTCNITCSHGFQLQGPKSRKCIGSSGIWSQRHTSSRCYPFDVQLRIKCPDDIIEETLPGKRFALINWTIPNIISNISEKPPHVWTKPHLTLPWKAKIGVHVITHLTQDIYGNKAKCQFKVKIIDKEPPTIYNCKSPPIFLTFNPNGAQNVTWDEPIFHDNSGKRVIIKTSHYQGNFFPTGITGITYNITDSSGNTANCVINITVQDACQNFPVIANGKIHCQQYENDDSSSRCIITCNEGYILPSADELKVGNEENIIFTCNPFQNQWNQFDYPDCTITEDPKTIDIRGNIILESGNFICNESSVLERLQMYIQQDLSKNIPETCSNNGIDCQVWNLYFSCQNNKTTSLDRLKRADDTIISKHNHKLKIMRKRERIYVKFRFITKIISDYRHDPQKAIEKLKEEIQSMTDSGKLNLFDERTNREIANLALNLRIIFDEHTERFCNQGEIFQNDNCIKCPMGTYYKVQMKKKHCLPCLLGEYQDVPGSIACKKCPSNYSTRRIRTTTINECVRICKAGFYSKKKYHKAQIVSLEPCIACALGTYQPLSGQKQCLLCPNNTSTNNIASIDVNSCIPNKNECKPESCLNNGRCIAENDGDTFFCDCPINLYGSRCEKYQNPCASMPCLNGGICSFIQGPSLYYYCHCKKSFTGHNCENYVDECLSNPCKNDGTCISTENDIKCNCKNGFTGEFCEISNDLCFNVCEEGSTCLIVNDGTWKCICKLGFLGRRCHLVPCDWLPCHPNAICVNLQEKNTTRESYKCTCPLGYEGDDCLLKINYCQSSPCYNGGICINNLSNYSCDCPMEYDGINCASKLSRDFILHFRKPPGTSNYIMFDGPKINLTEFTICFWFQSTDSFNYGTVFSYANFEYDNAITVMADYNGLVLCINGLSIITDITLNDGFWHFICVSWRNSDGHWFIYIDGILRNNGKLFVPTRGNSINSILGNGSIIIGQEQDDVHRRSFSLSESFVGRITLLDVWNVSLSEDFIKNISQTCDYYSGTIISWAGVKKKIFGNIMIEKSYFCHKCENPIAPFKGYVNISDYDFSAVTATYFCELGYNLKISNRIQSTLIKYCLKQGQWDSYSDEIKCVKVICGYPEYFPRGKVHGNSFSYGDELYYSCDNNYELRGNPHRVCNSDGKWSGKPPICIGLTCISLLAPEHGDIEYLIEEYERDDLTMIQVGQQLEFKCNLGFKLIGESILTCTKSGLWDHKMPHCQKIMGCLPPVIIEHGHINPTNISNYQLLNNSSLKHFYNYGDIVKFVCNNGYKFINNEDYQAISCSTNGSWIGLINNCTSRLKCPWPSKIEHARYLNVTHMNDSNEFTTKLLITCEDGYLASHNDIVCQNTGKWSTSDLVCSPLHCSSLLSHPIANLFITSSIMEAKLHHQRSYFDKLSSSLSDNLRHLTIEIEGERLYDKFILRCSDEKTNFNFINIILSEMSWRCNTKGMWEPHQEHPNLEDDQLRKFLTSKDVCQYAICHLPSIINPKLVMINVEKKNNWKFNESLQVECRSGFTLHNESGMIFCQKNGSWSSFPECKSNYCKYPPKVINAEPNNSQSIDSNGSFTFEQIIKYSCLIGYRMFGQNSIKCLANGQWSKFQGKCTKISCGKPKTADGIIFIGKSYLYLENLHYICPGNSSRGIITCTFDGTWSALPLC